MEGGLTHAYVIVQTKSQIKNIQYFIIALNFNSATYQIYLTDSHTL